MLSVDRSNGSAAKTTPNLLPCRIHHDGPVGSADSYWMPSTDSGSRPPGGMGFISDHMLNPDVEGKRIAYFRGRQLHGKVLKVPEGYRGVVVEKKDALLKPAGPRRAGEPEVIDVDAEEDEMPLGELDKKAEFDEMVIWGHESVADASADPYVRGVDEWMMLAEQVCRKLAIWLPFIHTNITVGTFV